MINADRVTEILDQLERDGRFDGLGSDAKEIERQMLGTRLAQNLEE